MPLRSCVTAFGLEEWELGKCILFFLFYCKFSFLEIDINSIIYSLILCVSSVNQKNRNKRPKEHTDQMTSFFDVGVREWS